MAPLKTPDYTEWNLGALNRRAAERRFPPSRRPRRAGANAAAGGAQAAPGRKSAERLAMYQNLAEIPSRTAHPALTRRASETTLPPPFSGRFPEHSWRTPSPLKKRPV